MSRPDIPVFSLYGEAPATAEDRFLHVELIEDRSSLVDWRIRPHQHGDLVQFLAIREGAGQVQADQRTWTFDGPTLILVPAGVVHGFAFARGTIGWVVTLSDRILRGLAQRDPAFAILAREPSCLDMAGQGQAFAAVLAAAAGILGELRGQGAGHRAAAEGHMLLLLAAMLRVARPPEAMSTAAGGRSGQVALVAAFRALVERHYRSHRPLDAYLTELRTSSSTLRAACLAVTGRPAIGLIQDRLMTEAKRLILYSGQTIAAVAYELGFEDPAYFSRFFNKQSGEAPRVWRRRLMAEWPVADTSSLEPPDPLASPIADT
ncbi:helix-turn-helix domain-containing protein [Nitrospirillum viridazoti]|uniref:AraC family transcriptional regulator n=1 Tax=Nitrospirillum viridazoti CBAmc TaxID=1441467 RepID=A0A248JYX4_9PROT|nr:helix-turn-helix domain-containing protein [Nitrospirillum amazonense]ASG23912.1 AraC family transcriptional regulator [Nitrospirillum amazonense CBAmc]TWB44654.1 AraC family transcriptional regulator [Nitrospirillum amazonense]